jgi:hypothetical protein
MDVASVPDRNDMYHELGIQDLVRDELVIDPDQVRKRFGPQGDAAGRARVVKVGHVAHVDDLPAWVDRAVEVKVRLPATLT